MLGGFPVVFGIHPHESEANPSHNLGTIGFTPDGRKFRYCKNNATNAMVAGDLQQSAAEDTGVESLLVAAAAIGSYEIVTTDTTTVTANEYADGYVVVTGEGGTGAGYMYKIKSHPAATAATVRIKLYEPIKVALSATSQIDLVRNPFKGVIINPYAAATGAPVGVAMSAVPASYYAWLQVTGPGLGLADDTIAVGKLCTASNAVDGAIEDGDTDTQAIIGVAATGIASGEYGLVTLNLP